MRIWVSPLRVVKDRFSVTLDRHVEQLLIDDKDRFPILVDASENFKLTGWYFKWWDHAFQPYRFLEHSVRWLTPVDVDAPRSPRHLLA